MDIHIIHTRQAMLLSKARYASWREIQDAYAQYQTSLGPWNAEDVVEYLDAEYSNLEPAAAQQVAAFVAGDSQVWMVRFASASSGSGHV